jgi:uncharacterized protein
MQKPVYTFKEFAREHFGGEIYKVPLDLGAGCPHRCRGGEGGCTFCPADGARAVQLGEAGSLEEQIERAVDFARRRYRAERFMAYLQTFTNTGADLSAERDLFEKIIASFPFAALSVGTRPDCLSEASLDMLAALNSKVEVWIDLGVQTVHDNSLQRVKRGHGWDESRRAIMAAAARGLHVAAHVIIGLPGEGREDFNATAAVLAELPLAGVKIHNLHVLADTQLGAEFLREPFAVFDEYDYAEHLIEFLRRLPPRLPVLRLCTDTPAGQLIAPRWEMGKGEFESMLFRQMELRELCQGDLVPGSSSPETGCRLEPVATADGSVTYWNPDYKEHYHSPVGARTEALEKYIGPSRLRERLRRGPQRLLDICFGLGYNSLCACELARGGELEVVALEIDRRAVGQAAQEIEAGQGAAFDWQIVLDDLYRDARSSGDGFRIEIRWGDARHTVRGLGERAFDVVFLDAFSTQRNSELWTLDFFRAVRRMMKPDAVLATYCAALPVRGGLMQAGFHVGESIPVGRKRGGTIAAMRADDIEHPISDRELETIRATSRGIPYRDPCGSWSNSKILRQRELARASRV